MYQEYMNILGHWEFGKGKKPFIYNENQIKELFRYEDQDINYVCRELEENGCKVITKPKIMQNSTTLLAFVEDPDGYKIELIQRS